MRNNIVFVQFEKVKNLSVIICTQTFLFEHFNWQDCCNVMPCDKVTTDFKCYL
jgi:hypothetical protein